MKNNRLLLVLGIPLILFVGWMAATPYIARHIDLAGGECGKTLITEKLSPEKTYVAKAVLVNCGATSDFETVFEVENLVSKESQEVLILKGALESECESSWVEAKTLLIECIGKRHVQIYNFKDKFEDTKVNFRLPDSFFMYDHPKPGQETNLVK